jgi:hypothetical protein
VGLEEDDKVSRTRWYEVERVTLSDGLLRVITAGKPLSLKVSLYGGAARRLVSEALKRIPKRVEIDDADIAAIGKPRATEGEPVEAEPPQVTLQRCRASKRAITFEKDARLCGRCGALYHRAEIPRRCLECGKKLKSH